MLGRKDNGKRDSCLHIKSRDLYQDVLWHFRIIWSLYVLLLWCTLAAGLALNSICYFSCVKIMCASHSEPYFLILFCFFPSIF